jgi:hypothetical protein
MEIPKFKVGAILLALMLLISGYLALWYLFPSIVNKFGGLNIISFGLTLFFASFPVLTAFSLFRYVQGHRFRPRYLTIALTYALLVIAICLAFVYDLLLPSSVPVVWRYVILPLATITVAFYALRSIPKVREKIDTLSMEW